MGIDKIDILSHLKINNFYSKEIFEEYDFLFNYYLKNKNFLNHGDLDTWLNILKELPRVDTSHIDVSGNHIVIGKPSEINIKQKKIIEKKLLSLSPWRKGPYNLFGLEIDAEWRSEKKWGRFEKYIPRIKGMRICDVGCSNGYYSYKLLNLEPELIIGLDKTPLFIIQFLAMKYYAKKIQKLIVLPCSLEEFSSQKIDFDLLISMGVLYHVKNPISHIIILNKLLKKNGLLLLESIISLKKNDIDISGKETYAGMKNVTKIFNKNNLINILKNSGFKNIECINESLTNSSEQRVTKWMQGKSISNFLLPSGNTLEGFPPICRGIFIAQKK